MAQLKRPSTIPVPLGTQALIFHASAILRRSAATRPSNDQREGMAAITYWSQLLLVMGTMRPPSTTWGMRAMGVSAMAASDEVTTVESRSPMEAALIAVTTM